MNEPTPAAAGPEKAASLGGGTSFATRSSRMKETLSNSFKMQTIHKRCSCCRKRKAAEPAPHLTMTLGHGDHAAATRAARPDNTVTTAKYNLINFIPYSFFGQFRQLNNCYFLLMYVLAQIGSTTSLNWFPSPIDPFGFLLALLVVLIVAMIFEGLYDLSRHHEDRKVNSQKVRVLGPKNVIKVVEWRDLRAGDLVMVAREEAFPADLALLGVLPRSAPLTSEEASALLASPRELTAEELEEERDHDYALCYVETSNIDGETNLKVRSACGALAVAADHDDHPIVVPPAAVVAESSQAPTPLASNGMVAPDSIVSLPSLDHLSLAAKPAAVVDVDLEAPPSTHSTKGPFFRERLPPFVKDDWSAHVSDWSITYEAPSSDLDFSGQLVHENACIAVDFTNLLLRGSILKNTHAVVGVVLYAGVETKASQSASVVRNKIGNATALVNRIVVVILFVGLVIDLVSAGVAYNNNNRVSAFWYLRGGDQYVFGPFLAPFFTFVILYSGLLPIALIISITIINVVQAVFVNLDVAMYCAEKNRGAKCASLELTQEIGQVAFLFSDKTGTLTRNEMKLVGVALVGVSGQTYGVQAEAILDESAADEEERGAPQGASASPTASDDTPVIFEKLVQACAEDAAPTVRERAREFLSVLALCHTVLVDGHGEGMRYNAEGPDEEALVSAVAKIGFKLVSTKRSVFSIESKAFPARHLYANEDHAQVESERYQGLERVVGYQVLAVNRFDSTRKRMSVVVRLPNGKLELMCKGADSVMIDLADHSEDTGPLGLQLDAFANIGFRTLIIGRRSVSEEEYARWLVAYQRAGAVVGAKNRTAALYQCAVEIEKNFCILGATAIEDRLQEGVQDTLRSIREAGIKTWVLTGDKVETAINIGFSAGLLIREMDLVQIVSPNKQANIEALKELARVVAGDVDMNAPTPRHSSTPKHTMSDGGGQHPQVLTNDVARDAELEEPVLSRRSSRSASAVLGATSPTSRVPLRSEARGEDPYGMHAYVGQVMENGFHKVTRRHHKRRSSSKTPPAPIETGVLLPSNKRSHNSLTSLAKSEGNGSSDPSSPVGRAVSPDTGSNASQLLPVGTDLSLQDSSKSPEPTTSEGVPPTSSSPNPAAPSSRAPQQPLGHASPHVSFGPTLASWSADDVSLPPQESRLPETNEEASSLALIVSGAALSSILNDSDTDHRITKEEYLFLSVAKACKVVVACRVSPRQKALLVRLVRRGVSISGKEPITMAVGDGANDVAMIQEARVGVGIAGREGSQAVNAADFSLAQFRFLSRLLLVHGRWNYRRMAFCVLYIFYSHIVPVVCAFAYQFVSLFSGTYQFYVTWMVAYSYIVVIPAVVVAFFNKDISAETALKYPSMYVSGRANLHLGRFKMMEYVSKALIHGALVSGFTLGFLYPYTVSFYELGTFMYFCVLLVVQSRLVLEVYTWVWPSALVIFLLFTLFLYLEPIIWSATPAINMYLPSGSVLWSPSSREWVWSSVWLVPVTSCMMFDVALTTWRRFYFPNPVDIVIEIDRGYGEIGTSKNAQLRSASEAFKELVRPIPINPEKIKKGLRGMASRFVVVPKFRSSYAYDVPEQSEAQTAAQTARQTTRRRWLSMSGMSKRKRGAAPATPAASNSNGFGSMTALRSNNNSDSGVAAAEVPVSEVNV